MGANSGFDSTGPRPWAAMPSALVAPPRRRQRPPSRRPLLLPLWLAAAAWAACAVWIHRPPSPSPCPLSRGWIGLAAAVNADLDLPHIEDVELVVQAKEKNTAAVVAELRAGFHPDTQTSTGATALQWAAHHGLIDMVSALVQSNADLNLPNHKGYSPLLQATGSGHAAVSLLLLRAGADPNEPVTKDSRSTPLMYASWKGMLEVVEALIDAGANMQAEDNHGHRAISIAEGSGHREIALLIARRSGEHVVPTGL